MYRELFLRSTFDPSGVVPRPDIAAAFFLSIETSFFPPGLSVPGTAGLLTN
jgi:hypothetical protein